MHSVLFVCAANICRSPLAMGILREKTRQNADEDWLVESAGVWARQGDRIESLSQLVVLEKGIDLSAHRSRRISADLLHDFNLILTMEMGQKEAIKAAFPQFSRKVYLISEMIDSRRDVVDPFGSSLQDFQDTARELEWILDKGYQRICQLSEGPRDENAKKGKTG